MSKLKAAIVLGTARPGRQGTKASNYLFNQLSKKKNFELAIIDPLEYKIALEENALFMMGPKDVPTKELSKLDKVFSEQDAFFVVSAEYNSLPPPPLLNLFDHCRGPSFAHKVAGILTYSTGPFGGIKSSVALRPFLANIGLSTVGPTAHLTSIGDADENGLYKDEKMNKLVELAIQRLIAHVEWTAIALKLYRETVQPPQ